MKKFILSALVIASSMGIANAQNAAGFTSKNGHVVLPQEGDWSFGISASPLLQYAGNLFSGANATNGAPAVANANGPFIQQLGANIGGVAFMGKYMKTATMAYKVRFQANVYSNTYNNYVAKSSATPNPLLPEFAEDQQVVNTAAFLLGGGIEKRRGSATRLQGIYGGEVLLGYSTNAESMSYGNAMDADYNAPTSTFFNTGGGVGGSGSQSSRVIERELGSTFFAGARGYVGVEYFIAPKISLGAEVGYTLGVQLNGNQRTVSETFDAGTLQTVNVEAKTFRNQGITGFGMGLDNANAGVNLNFYF
ncbi:MAG: hypothetical protein KBE91_02545 [Bacteroidia bacterium]|nr:hypothetical protein [Bacteroidia bacterium]MBP9688461.1 hypothetical protein [Bacteroidia bacterium]